jgi:hypothetical protein
MEIIKEGSEAVFLLITPAIKPGGFVAVDTPAPFGRQLRGYTRSFLEEVRAKPLDSIVTIFVLTLLFLHLKGRINVDGWAIALFVIALLPWSLPVMLSTFEAFSDAFGRSKFKSVQFGNFKIEQLEQKVSEQAQQIDEQRRLLDDLALYSMAFYIYHK